MRVILVHTLEHAQAALEAASKMDTPVTLQSAPDAIFYAGPAYLLRMFEQAHDAFPAADAIFILDCADTYAETISAMQLGCRSLRSSAPAAIRSKLREIAVQYGIRLHDGPYEALDLHTVRDTKDACIQWLKGAPCK